MRSLERLLDPRSIAVIGGDPAEKAARQSIRLGFEGSIWPVHPTRSEVAGLPAFTTLDDLPGVPDAAFVAVNRSATVDLVHQLADMGAGGAVLYAAGFAESGPEGAALQAALVDGHHMPLIGPNCYGTINALSGAALWPDVHGCGRVERGPAFIGQSGNITLNVTMNTRGVGFTHAISVGNQVSVTLEEAIAHLASDDRVTAIGLYVESIVDPIAFAEAAAVAHRHATPLVALKAGQSDEGAVITSTHSAAIVSPAEAYQALFDRYGVVTVDTLPDLLAVLSLHDTIGPLGGNRLISMSCSGGEAALVADRSRHHGVRFEPLDDDHAARIRSTLSDLVTVSNPLDYHTFIWGDADALAACFTETLDGPVDAGLLILDWPAEEADDTEWWPTLEAIETAAAKSGTPTVVAASLPENMPESVRSRLAGSGLGALFGIDEALAAVAALASIGTHLAGPIRAPHFSAGTAATAIATLDEAAAKSRLSAAGVQVPRGSIAADGRLPPGLEYPVAVKVVGEAHKTDVEGVILGVADDLQLRTALERLGGSALVEEMVGDTLAELLVSVRRLPPLGVTITLGAGGTLVEILDDRTTLLLPTDPEAVCAALASLRLWPAFEGQRGRPPASIEAVVAAVEALQGMVVSNPDIVEIEINPLIVTTDRAVAVDALIEIDADIHSPRHD